MSFEEPAAGVIGWTNTLSNHCIYGIDKMLDDVTETLSVTRDDMGDI